MQRGRMPLGSLVQTHDHVFVAVRELRLSAVVAPRTSAVPVRLCPVVAPRISAVPVRLSPVVVLLASCGGLGARISAVPVRLSLVVV